MKDNRDVQNEIKEEVENPNLKVITLQSPIEIDGTFFNEIQLDFSNMTGADVFQIDAELKTEDHPEGFNSVYNQHVLLKIASKASGILPDDLMKLSIVDFVEVTFTARNFLLGL